MIRAEDQEIAIHAGARKIFSVSEINREIRGLLEKQFPVVWIEGEVSNFKYHTSGHMYLTLKDEKSQLGAVFFSRYNQGLKFQLKDGLQVIALGRISLYEPRGQYQLYIERLEPKGVGALQLALRQLKEKLEKEGLFDPAHKKPVPKFPRVVGVVTSPTGAAIRDILNVVGRRFYGTEILLNPVRVQGEGAAEEIARAIGEMNRIGNVDVLIVGRGGGSLEDLWAFNEEVVARAIFASKIPVISAVGHEIDWTICDWVADLRAPTPSAAAELVVQNREEIKIRLADLTARMRQGMFFLTEDRRHQLEGLESSYALKQPLNLVYQYSQRLDEWVRQLQNYARAGLSNKEHGFRRLAGRLEALSPLAVLERGYSLTYSPKGTLIKESGKLRVGDTVITRVSKGEFEARVTDIRDTEETNHG